MRFVLGHELGHILSRNANKMKLFKFMFPSWDSVPVLLKHKYRLWTQLSELTADRFGMIAMHKLNLCLSAFFTLSP